MPSPWHSRAATPSPAATLASQKTTTKVVGLAWSCCPAFLGDGFVLCQPAGSEPSAVGWGETPPQHPQPRHPQRGVSGGHLCVFQVLRVLSHPEELKRRWQLWLWAAAELAGGLLMMFVKTLN